MKLWKRLHLVEQVADPGRFGQREEVSAGPVHPVTPLEDDLADLAVMDTLGQFLERPAVTRHQSHPDLEVLGGGVLREAEHALAGGAVDRDRLLHKDIQALLDGVGEMHPAKRRGRGENGDIARLQTIHRFLVGVEADELAVRRHVHLARELLLQIGQVFCEPLRKDVGHGDQLGRTALDGERVRRGAAAPSAAADQGDLDQVGARGVDGGNGHVGQSRSRRQFAGGLHEFTAGRRGWIGSVHGGAGPPMHVVVLSRTG